MKLSATDFGIMHDSCIMRDRIEFDRANPGAGQAGFYEACQNGEYLLWQLRQLYEDQLKPYRASLVEVARRAALRARGWESMAVVVDADFDLYANDAAMISANAANAAEEVAEGGAVFFVAGATTRAAKWAGQAAAFSGGRSRQRKELELQAYDIHELIPVWPGE